MFGGVNGHAANYLSEANFFSINGIENYKFGDGGYTAKPLFILDYMHNNLYFDKNGSLTTSDPQLVCHLEADIYGVTTNFADFDADQILIMSSADYYLV